MDTEKHLRLRRLMNRYAVIMNKHRLKNFLSKEDDLSYKLSITPFHANILVVLYIAGPQRNSELATYMNSEPPNIARRINELMEKELVVKQKQPGKKAVYVDLTDTARAAVYEKTKLESEIEASIYDKYISEFEQEELFGLYSRLIEILSQLP